MWKIRSYCLRHINCTSVARPSIKQLQTLQAPVTATLSDFTVSSNTMVNNLYDATGMKITKHQALRARAAIAAAKAGGDEEGFMDTKAWLEQVAAANPTSHTAFRVSPAGRFDAALFVLPLAVEVLEEVGMPVYCLDGAHVKHKQNKLQLLVLEGTDGAGNNVLVALCVCLSEDAFNCHWMLQEALKLPKLRALLEAPGTTIMSDRGTAIVPAVAEALPNALHVHCSVHMLRNVDAYLKKNRQPKLTPRQKSTIWGAQAAATELEFNAAMSIISVEVPVAYEYLTQKTDARTWAVCYAQTRGFKLFGIRSNNPMEGENGRIKPARFVAPLRYLKEVLEMEMRRYLERALEVEKWYRDGYIITHNASNLYQAEEARSKAYNAKPSSENIYFVSQRGLQPVDPRERRVDLKAKTCSCILWDQLGIPCRHAIAAKQAKDGGTIIDALAWFTDAFAPQYNLQNFLKAFSRARGIELPLAENVCRDEEMLSPLAPPPGVGRPNTLRFVGAAEGSGGHVSKKQRTCGKCNGRGHNTRTCTAP
ncbi:unnamed protein product [Phaeothamnion confervicola]